MQFKSPLTEGTVPRQPFRRIMICPSQMTHLLTYCIYVNFVITRCTLEISFPGIPKAESHQANRIRQDVKEPLHWILLLYSYSILTGWLNENSCISQPNVRPQKKAVERMGRKTPPSVYPTFWWSLGHQKVTGAEKGNSSDSKIHIQSPKK
jgi:hypothetical protein